MANDKETVADMAQEMRKVAKCYSCSEVPLGFDKRDIATMLRYAADVVEENAKLNARLEAVVKIASDNLWCENSGVIETDTCAKLHNSYMSDILHSARDDGGAK